MRSKTLLGALLALLVVTGGVVGLAAAQEGTTDTPQTDTAQTDDQRPTDRQTDDRPAEPPADAPLSEFLDRLNLTDDQRTAIEDEVTEMRADGASAHAIRLVAHGRLHQFGVTDTELRDARFDHRLDNKLDRLQNRYNLSDREVETVRDAVEDARADGSNPGELREVALDTLEELGYDVSDLRERWNEHSAKHWHRHHRGHGHGHGHGHR
ncbi:hypothetical protein C453_16558 [Haloferax elongans ATCC BAA-1513]|uniref:Uncharacterized protein n=1 Tax=Haloferax elongans ATCC BAA-1513 TaxID=1230453 RepID=M0HDZ4_HALEO|nr:hypothetical protein [Haloferax elongans]ELZ82715.1 hypothetical protein C453_16558 [Haloferax elongans ATCC BAA-1513]